LSIVFDARKNADRSKRAREASARPPQLPGTAPDSADPQNVASGVNVSNQPVRPAIKPNQTLMDAAATGTGAAATIPATTGAATTGAATTGAAATHPATTNAAATVAGGPENASRGGVDLKAERRAADWRLRWNRSCAANAVRGRLSIKDGAARQQLDLDIAELQTGSIVYAPVTSEVFFRLEIVRPYPEEALSESVRVVAGGIAAQSLPEQNRRAPLTERNVEARIARSNGAWARGTDTRPGPGPRTGMSKEAAQADAPLVRSLLRTSYPQAVSSVMSSSVPGSPVPGFPIRGPSVRGVSAPGPSTPGTFVGPPARGSSAPDFSVANSPAKNSSIRDSSTTGRADFAEENDKLEPATLIVRTDPVYPAIARQSHISGSVEVQFRVSPEGRVYDVKSLKGWPILAKAAIDAVATWRYEPARRNGRPVESQVTTNFDFKVS
jgi:TonB family protein